MTQTSPAATPTAPGARMSTANMPPDLKSLLDDVLDPIIDADLHTRATGDVQGAAKAFETAKAPMAKFYREALAMRRMERGIS